MTEMNGKSLWELAGYPSEMRGGELECEINPDLLFQMRSIGLDMAHGNTCEKIESTLAWGMLRDDSVRKLFTLESRPYFNAGLTGEPGPIEQLEYAALEKSIIDEENAQLEQSVKAGANPAAAQALADSRISQRLFGVAPKRRRIPGSTPRVTVWQRHAGLLSLAYGVLLGVSCWGVATIFKSFGFANAAASFVLECNLWGVYAGISFLLSYLFYSRASHTMRAVPRSIILDEFEESGVDQYRGKWPFYVLGSVILPFLLAAPFLVSSVALPLVCLLFAMCMPQNFKESLKPGNAPLSFQEFLKKKVDRNLFVPADTSMQAEGPGMPASLPAFTRMGDMCDSIPSIRESTATVGAHCLITPRGENTDVASVAAGLIMDVVAGVTGSTNPVSIAQYGNGLLRLVAKATALATGHEIIELRSVAVGDVPAPSVADWWKDERDAYVATCRLLLEEPTDRMLAAQVASSTVDSIADASFDIPWLVRLRLETIAYGLRAAAVTLQEQSESPAS